MDELMITIATDLLNRGMDFEVKATKNFKTKVTLIDTLTTKAIGEATEDTMEQALSTILTTIASRATKDGMLSYL